MAQQRGTRSAKQKGAALLLPLLFLPVALVSCAASPQATATASSVPATSSPATRASVDPAVAGAVQTMEATLKKVVAATPKPDQETVRAALVAAGIPRDNVEVSVSRTPTGLDVDAMEAAALAAGTCVMGQIRDGAVVVTVLPALASGKCFIGDAR